MQRVYKKHPVPGGTGYKNSDRGRGIDMEFLKAFFGDKALTYDEFVQAINAHNGIEANANNQIKLANLGSGEYVGKGKYDALAEQLSGKENELGTANSLIEELRAKAEGSIEMQSKFAAYDQQVKQLQDQLQDTKLTAAAKVMLMEEGCSDIKYATFVLKENLAEQGKALELDDNDNIKNRDEIISGLKVQIPAHFNTGKNNRKVLGDNRLNEGDNRAPSITKEQFHRMGYNERMQLKESNEQLFRELSKTSNT